MYSLLGKVLPYLLDGLLLKRPISEVQRPCEAPPVECWLWILTPLKALISSDSVQPYAGTRPRIATGCCWPNGDLDPSPVQRDLVVPGRTHHQAATTVAAKPVYAATNTHQGASQYSIRESQCSMKLSP